MLLLGAAAAPFAKLAHGLAGVVLSMHLYGCARCSWGAAELVVCRVLVVVQMGVAARGWESQQAAGQQIDASAFCNRAIH